MRTAAEELNTTAARGVLQLAFMVSDASWQLHAIAITLVRLVTRRRLLEWETTAASAARGGTVEWRAFVRRMVASPLLAVGTLALVAFTRAEALPFALPVLLLWIGAPWIAFAVSRPTTTRRVALTPPDRDYLLVVAGKTWKYFEAFVGAADHALPPDNVQFGPEPIVAHRTSPTNMGLSLLANLAAHDFGYLSTDRLIARTASAFVEAASPLPSSM